ncbi:MAG: glycosyltransferase [Nanoarchaeota archaeon]
MNPQEKIGIVVMFKMNHGGGAPRVVVDLIKTLHALGHAAHFLTPWKLDHEKIKEIFEPIEIEREYNLSTLKSKWCVEPNFSRTLMKKQFQKMAENVDLIIDIDGGVLHDYLPENKKYVIWRISGIEGEKTEWEKNNVRRKLKNVIKNFLSPQNNTLSKNHKIYAVDKWTKERLMEKWNLQAEKIILYPEIKTTQIKYHPENKKNQAIILGRISPNKRIDESLHIFAQGAKESDYKLIIIGGVIAESSEYIQNLKDIAQKEKILDRVEFIQDPPFELLKKTIQESKILIESQRDISLTMTSIECLAAGVVVLVHKNGGTFNEVLENGKYGVGFVTIPQAAEKLKKIIKGLAMNKINPALFTKRAEFFSAEKFKERLTYILKENGI